MKELEEPKSLFPHGYGTAWSEPLATDPKERKRQIGREPATKADYEDAFTVAGLQMALVAIAIFAAVTAVAYFA